MMPCVVMLSEVEASPRHGRLYVILNEVKNLEVSVAVDGSTNLEILRFTQDDIEPTMARRCFDFAQHDNTRRHY